MRGLNWLIPRRCQQCDCVVEAEWRNFLVCRSCYAQLPFQEHSCQRCGQVFAAQQDSCGRCLLSPPPFDACFCPFQYQQPISGAIQRLKYQDQPELADRLARALAFEIEQQEITKPELLIPVPVHLSRLRARGFNQSLLLTKRLSQLLNTPYSNQIIQKHRATPAQAQQTLAQRQINVRGSFKLGKLTTAKHIAIIDDVFTTGATASEITKVLKRNGVNYVQVWGLAHTN